MTLIISGQATVSDVGSIPRHNKVLKCWQIIFEGDRFAMGNHHQTIGGRSYLSQKANFTGTANS
jgi:hypothetical protein